MLRRVLDRESVVKSNLIKRLVDCVKELQFKYAADKGATLVNDETTNLLCWILEAVFIHGLKNTFLKSMTSVFQSTAGKENALPEPSFWEFVLIFCHQEVIVQINKLSYISTDVGRCRAWLRLALNDGLYLSYLQMMLKDRSTLKEYYKPTAFLRDSEMCDLLKSYLCGMESYDFQLASNSSLLNAWNSGPLSLVGLWTYSNPNENVSQGIDVAENMNSRDLQVLPALQSGHDNNSRPKDLPYVTRPPLLHEEEALKVILASKPAGSSGNSSRRSSTSTPPKDSFFPPLHPDSPGSSSVIARKPVEERQRQGEHRRAAGIDNILSNDSKSSLANEGKHTVQPDITINTFASAINVTATTPVTSVVDQPNIDDQFQSHSTLQHERAVTSPVTVSSVESVNTRPARQESKLRDKCEVEEESFMNLLKTYQHHQIGTPIMNNYFDSIFPERIDNKNEEENRTSSPSSDIRVDRLGFELLSVLPSSEQFSAAEMMPHLKEYLQKIPNEAGLDSQNYRCKNCDRPIGMFYGPAKLCALSGNYFCQECHTSDESVIPARILLNWDFGRYTVSKQGKLFVDDIVDQPIFDLQQINSNIYQEVEECQELKTLRTKLQIISIYLRTCKEPVMKELTKEIWPKDHLYEDIHLYSLGDLLNIPNGILAATLSRLVNWGKSHILTCDICKQKGFVCEICKDPKVIFPFDFERNFKCLNCGAVYHSTCMNSKIPCPRCVRWKCAFEDRKNLSDQT